MSVLVRGWPADAGDPPDPQVLGAELQAFLAASGGYQRAAAPPGTHAVRIRAEVLVELDAPPEPLSAAAIVKADLEDDLPLYERVMVETARPAPGGTPAAARAVVGRALDLAGAGVVAKERLRRGDPAALGAALGGNDRDRTLYALAVVAERRVNAFRGRAVELLASKDEEIRDAAIGALARIGDASSLPALTGLAKFGDADTLRRVLHAVASIGGDDARSFLEFVAAGHAEPAIRELATEALRSLDPKPLRPDAPR